MKVGFIGLGIMGSRMAANLQKKGFNLIVHNRSRDKAQPLLEAGADWAPSVADAAAECDVLFTMLSTPEVVEVKALGESGFVNAMRSGAIWVDCSTVSPALSHRMAGLCRGKGVRFLDAPVAGSKIPAENGQLVFLVGGEAEDVETCRPLFEAMGRAIVHVGSHGSGASMKLVVNSLLAASMLAFAEGLVLGQSLGLSRQTLLDTLLSLPVTAPFIGLKRGKIERGDYEPEFPLQWMHKDLQLADEAAYENVVPLLLLGAAKQVYGLARGRGFADRDFSAIYQFLTQTNT
jgi:3-hydroxyisobutyrate dehydrogenase/glyoxylate/succinic semialdehyde reductase